MAKNMPLTSDDPSMQKAIERKWHAINNSVVTVGVHEDAGKYSEGNNPPSVAEVAFFNHFGTKDIPARPFISQAIDVNRYKFNQLQDQLLNQVIEGRLLVIQALKKLGKRIEIAVVNTIDEANNWAVPNAQSTADQKNKPGGGLRGATPLIRSGLLKRSITSRVQKAGGNSSMGVT